MKKLFPAALVIICMFAACNHHNNSGSSKIENGRSDSLMKEVDEDHNTGMSKMAKLSKAQKFVQQAIDSIAKLPDNMKKAAAPYKMQLDSILDRLKYSEYAMNKWMEEFNMDSALNDVEKRIQYLGQEKLKISRVKDVMIRSLEKADSLLRQKTSCKGERKEDCICIQIYKPVCGCDGKTYGNDCVARCEGVKEWTEGECPEK